MDKYTDKLMDGWMDERENRKKNKNEFRNWCDTNWIFQEL